MNKIKVEKLSQKGAVLITLIVAMVITALAGSAMLYYSTTSAYGELFANRQQRAYYVAESGANYALQKFAINKVTNGPFPTPTEFTSGNDKFIIKTYDKPEDSTHLIIESTGIVGSGWLTTRQLVTRDILKTTATPPGIPPISTDASGVPLGFDANNTYQPDGTNPLDSTWSLATGTTTDEAYVNVDGDLEFKTREAAIVLNADLVSLCNAWMNNGNLSSYFLQVKIKNNKNSDAYYMHGISFRVKDIAAKNSYGLSFYKHDNKKYKGDWCANLDWCEYDSIPQKVVNNGKIYAILWKRVNGVASLLAYAQMKTDTFSYGVTNADGTELIAWSTLLIRVNERSDGNHLKAYVQSIPTSGTYPQGTVHWNISSFKQITWNWTCNTASCSSTTPFTEVIDSTFLSTDFCTGTTQKWPEIGIHAFYDNEGSGAQLFDDFSMAVQGTTGGGSQY